MKVKLILLLVTVFNLSGCDNANETKKAFQKTISYNHPAILIDTLKIEGTEKNKQGIVYVATGNMKLTENTYELVSSMDDIKIIQPAYYKGDIIPYSVVFTIFNSADAVMIHSLSTRRSNIPYPIPFYGAGFAMPAYSEDVYIYNPDGESKDLIDLIYNLKVKGNNIAQNMERLSIENESINDEIDNIRAEAFILSNESEQQIAEMKRKLSDTEKSLKSCYKEKDSFPFMGSSDSHPELRNKYEEVGKKCDALFTSSIQLDSQNDIAIDKIVHTEKDIFQQKNRQRIAALDENLDKNKAESHLAKEEYDKLKRFLTQVANKIGL